MPMPNATLSRGPVEPKVAVGKLLRILRRCGSLHLLARFTGYPFRVFDLTLRLPLFAEVAPVEQLALALFQRKPAASGVGWPTPISAG